MLESPIIASPDGDGTPNLPPTNTPMVLEHDLIQHTPPGDTPAAGSYHIMTWGCQMNEEDSEQMSLYLEEMGYTPVDSAEVADVVLLNTCSVRAKPEDKVWSVLGRLRELKRERPDLVIGVCGCMAQVESVEIARRAPHVDMVVGTGNIAALPQMIAAVRPNPPTPFPDSLRFARREGGGETESRTMNSTSELVGSSSTSAPSPTELIKAGFVESTSQLPQNGSTLALAPPSRRSEVSELGIAGVAGENRRFDTSSNRTFDTSSGAGGLGRPLIPLAALTSKSGQTTTLTALALPPRKGAIVSDIPQRIAERKAKIKAHVPIMYGCDKFCTFCIVPFTRGRERSRPTDDILREIEGLARQGTREITLLGQTVNSYGKNLPEGRVPFCDLLDQIDAIRGLQRVRFTSPYPRDFTDDLIDTIGRLATVCEHVHLPLQVGDDDLLREMHRQYTVEQFLTIVDKLRQRVPGIAITTDIMLGYPGETDRQFQNTLDIVRQVRFDSAFMFAYSPRPHTKAAEMENQLPQELKIERLNELIALQNGITVEINKAQCGQTFDVLVEGRSQKDAGKLFGYTRTLKMVNFTVPDTTTRSLDSLIGKTVPVRTDTAHLTGFLGELAPAAPLE